ncbi:hypothetical protein ABB37_06035 [Leptomonas pyrrhocoris]|uniref:Uncharacterized protein n=1 Tax=Leptomonas pyrrhocoris TaxID=157538 RepID=A0A0M9FZ57_LEPPY|nr:hypothetical protein ABB37_06025 [Leptomonas pyrrhocoris]XP_015657402.1 hypothetical protein ABB37_06027 [Leptomonas pyrrhocoris]XP_015657404.1 hypothetical protein ABB37_06029 [Leptomonas pyrrhocoris]XP_015657406.1 hypothetical protein ABB37_06031 [Leptomonas pyrrhocoris]XP_015657408.1 hypothetical protein ABB37_06033 [Leptomonas pyrrhocoris]XP_015657410.1 hypothetical protein ABB37_06035 [Leptomonas pyrrhocoris]KPA78961.1 hypothetical protein ABB37_06025 [Leptomonas pyrrhocoris]KPA78963|eukprot:XP_015657400.1 hypothetical protein ABB37_06025 [Leptomonas pyrrhocoris]
MQPKMNGTMVGVERDRERAYVQHRERVASQRRRIDNDTPASCAYARKPGAVRTNPARAAQIDRDNAKLVEKMVHIMNTKGGVDTSEPWRDHNRAVNSQRTRQQRQAVVAEENARMLERLERAAPTYRADKFAADRRRNEEFAARASRYPYRPMDKAGS